MPTPHTPWPAITSEGTSHDDTGPYTPRIQASEYMLDQLGCGPGDILLVAWSRTAAPTPFDLPVFPVRAPGG